MRSPNCSVPSSVRMNGSVSSMYHYHSDTGDSQIVTKKHRDRGQDPVLSYLFWKRIQGLETAMISLFQLLLAKLTPF